MSYTVIQPPFSLDFRTMSRPELLAYFNWFLKELPQRVIELEKAVRATNGYATGSSDMHPNSLNLLGEWFERQVEVRLRTDDEREKIAASSSLPIEIPKEELTNRTFSLAYDIGIYLGETFRKNYEFLNWEQPLSDKKFADYGQPVLMGFGAVPLNPIRISINLAYGMVSGTQSGKRLREVYEYWAVRAVAKK